MGPRSFDNAGHPLHSDNQTIIKERIYRDKNDPDILKSKPFVEKVDELWNLVRIEAIKAQGGRAP